MIESFWLIAAGVCTLLSMAWLALSLKFHWRQVYPDPDCTPHEVRLRSAGFVFLLLSVFCCFKADHPSMAVLVWVMLLPVAAVMVAITLSRYPRLLLFVCPLLFARRFLPGNN